jgi:hypothetical protein
MLLENGILVSFVCLFLEGKKKLFQAYLMQWVLLPGVYEYDCICPKILI